MLSQGDVSGGVHLVQWLQTRWKRPYVGLVHRLDRNTSGLMVVGQRTKAASRLTEELQSGGIRRTYLAWVKAQNPRTSKQLPQTGSWDHLLLRDESTKISRVVTQAQRGAQTARLNYQVLRHERHYALVEFVLDTGRSHQIRAQAAHEGFPILGDLKYGGQPFSRMALHSHTLEFNHPVARRRLYFLDPLPEELRHPS